MATKKKKEMKSVMLTCEKCGYVCVLVVPKSTTTYKCGKCGEEKKLD